jgi:acyl-CoA dehydrogenase
MGDVLSNLYLTMAVLNHFEQEGSHEEDLPLVHWAAQNQLHQAEQAFDELFDNLHSKALGAALKHAVFPPTAGHEYKAPSDKLSHEVAKLIAAPTPSRDRLTAGIYKPQLGEKFREAAADGQIVETKYTKPLAVILEAEPVSIASEPVEAKLAKAVKGEEKLAQKGEEAKLPSIRALMNQLREDDRPSLLQAAFKDGVLSQEERELLEKSDALRARALQVDTFTQDMRPL